MNFPSIFYALLTVLLGVVMPVLGIAGGKKTMRLLTETPNLRTAVFQQSMIMLLSLTGLVFFTMFLNHDALVTIGAGFLLKYQSIIFLVISCLLFLLVVNIIPIRIGLLAMLQKSYSRVMYIIPANQKQYVWSIVLSFVAGFCEEIIYRGFLFYQAMVYLPVVPSVLLVNLIFGLCHWGTGIKNALWSFGLGVFWSLTFLWTGSLWLAILTHIMVDLMSMSIGYKINLNNRLSSNDTAPVPKSLIH